MLYFDRHTTIFGMCINTLKYVVSVSVLTMVWWMCFIALLFFLMILFLVSEEGNTAHRKISCFVRVLDVTYKQVSCDIFSLWCEPDLNEPQFPATYPLRFFPNSNTFVNESMTSSVSPNHNLLWPCDYSIFYDRSLKHATRGPPVAREGISCDPRCFWAIIK